MTGSQIAFTPDDSIKILSGFKPKEIHEKYNLLDYPVNTLPFDNIFLETDFAQGVIFECKRSGKNSEFYHGRRSLIKIYRKI